MQDNQQNQPHIDIELSEEIAEGIYSNLAIITHSQSEFVLDFIKIYFYSLGNSRRNKLRIELLIKKFF